MEAAASVLEGSPFGEDHHHANAKDPPLGFHSDGGETDGGMPRDCAFDQDDGGGDTRDDGAEEEVVVEADHDACADLACEEVCAYKEVEAFHRTCDEVLD